MNLTRVVAWSCGAGFLVVWLAAAAGTWNQDVPATPAGERRAVPPATEVWAPDYEAQARRLRAYARTAPTPRRPSRNPFGFLTGARPEGPEVSEGRVPKAPPAAEMPEPTADVVLTLIGVAVDDTPAGLERTGILSGEGQLLLVKVGDRVGARLRVAAVEAGAVVLEDVLTGRSVRLELR